MPNSSSFCAKPDKQSSFAQTCNLLSRYIKEKGSLRDLNIEIGGKVESVEAIVNPKLSIAGNKRKSAEEPRPPSVDSPVIVVEDDPATPSTSREEAKIGQLTIFYMGRVLVFDDYPMQKARELVSMAKRSGSQMSYGIYSNTKIPPPTASTSATRDGLPPRPCKSSVGRKEETSPPTTEAVARSAPTKDKQIEPEAEAGNGSDLPIARRSSLHRFLAKRRRKDRAVGGCAGAIYQIGEQPQRESSSSSSSSSKGIDQLDLNL